MSAPVRVPVSRHRPRPAAPPRRGPMIDQNPGDAVTARPGTLLAAIIGGALAVLYLWWRNAESVHGLGDWLTAGGRVSGLLAGYGVAVLLALMSPSRPR